MKRKILPPDFLFKNWSPWWMLLRHRSANMMLALREVSHVKYLASLQFMVSAFDVDEFFITALFALLTLLCFFFLPALRRIMS